MGRKNGDRSVLSGYEHAVSHNGYVYICLNGRDSVEFDQLMNSAYTRNILFDDGNFQPSSEGQYSIKSVNSRTAPPRFPWPFPRNGYPVEY